MSDDLGDPRFVGPMATVLSRMVRDEIRRTSHVSIGAVTAVTGSTVAVALHGAGQESAPAIPWVGPLPAVGDLARVYRRPPLNADGKGRADVWAEAAGTTGTGGSGGGVTVVGGVLSDVVLSS